VAWTWKLVEKLSVNENDGDNDDDAVDILQFSIPSTFVGHSTGLEPGSSTLLSVSYGC